MRRGVFFFVLVFSFLFFSWSKVVWKKGNLVKYRVFTRVEVRSCRASNQFYSLSFVPSFLLLLLVIVVVAARKKVVRILNKNLLYVQSPKKKFPKEVFLLFFFFFFLFSF